MLFKYKREEASSSEILEVNECIGPIELDVLHSECNTGHPRYQQRNDIHGDHSGSTDES